MTVGNTGSSNRLVYVKVCVGLAILVMAGKAQAQAQPQTVDYTNSKTPGVMASCPPTWPGVKDHGAKLDRAILWSNYSIDPPFDDVDSQKGTLVENPYGHTYQFACKYDGGHWLTVVFPNGKLGECGGRDEQDDKKKRVKLWCEIHHDDLGRIGDIGLYPAEEISLKTKLAGFRLRMSRAEIEALGQKNGFVITEDGSEKLLIRREEIFLEIFLRTNQAGIKEAFSIRLFKSPRKFGVERAIDHFVEFHRFGLAFKEIWPDDRPHINRWASRDGTIIVDSAGEVVSGKWRSYLHLYEANKPVKK
jgi:hypothetical protein